MPTLNDVHVDAILASWLSGAESAEGLANPAGPLYVGGAATEAALTDSTLALFSGCSACTASGGGHCC